VGIVDSENHHQRNGLGNRWRITNIVESVMVFQRLKSDAGRKMEAGIFHVKLTFNPNHLI